MQSRFNLFLLALLLLTSGGQVLSQDIRFNKVSLPEEIGPDVAGITQDIQGNIWLCFVNTPGLLQYDGANFKSFVNDQFNPNSLAHNRVECVYADKSGNIWAGTVGFGLDKFDPQTGLFTHYKHDQKDPSSISGDSIMCIIQDRQGFLWVGTKWSGLNRMDPSTGKFTHYQYNENDSTSLSFNQVRTLYEDKQGVIWAGAGSNFDFENPVKKGGLNRFNSSTGTFTRYMHDENNVHSLIDDRVRAIFEDSYGTFWVGTAGDGLHTMDRATGTFERHTYDPALPEKLSRPAVKKLYGYADDNITFITEDSRKAIWIGTFGNGVSRYEPETKKITHYSGEKNSKSNLTESSTWWAFTSREGVLWISTWLNGGLYKVDAAHQNVLHTGSFTKSLVLSFVDGPDPFQYFGIAEGLVQMNTKDKSTKLFVDDSKKPGSLSGNFPFGLLRDSKERLWVGTQGTGGGLNLFNPDTQTFTSYRHDPKVSTSLIGNRVLCIYEDASANLWIGTQRGLDKMNVEKGEFTHYKPYPEDTIQGGKNFVVSMVEDSKHNLWVGSWSGGGISMLNPETGKFKHYLPNSSIASIHQDGNGQLWAGAYDGLYAYNATTDSFTLFVDPSTGTGIRTLAMVEDNYKNLWIASVTGIYRINSLRNEVTKFSKAFGITEGLINLSAGKAKDGKLIFGSETGYYSFYPDKISSNAHPPEIILTELRIAGRPIKPGVGSELKEDLLQAKQVDLSYDQEVFAFSFNVVHYSNPEGNKAMYWLENYDEGWRPVGSERVAYYYGIPPGHYTFHIKAASSEGVWAEKSIEVNIAPPWWRTWWAYSSYVVLFAGFAFTADRTMRRRIKMHERERNRERELKQAKEIEKAYTELKATQSQLIQSEKMASLGELTAGIAHEIQNPLNFVNNFSEVNSELIAEMKDELVKGHLDEAKNIANDIDENEKKIIFHGKRAAGIVKGMLQHSRSSSGVKEPTDINVLADEYLRLAYHGLRAKDKSFNASMKTDFDESIGKINAVPQDLGRVILNLITNAFYVVTEKKKKIGVDFEPTVTVSTKKVNGKVEIRVKDNGNGIPQKILDKIFQPFFTTKPTGQGTGLGLSMSYDIITKSHAGEIKVETKEGEGSEFIIVLPQ